MNETIYNAIVARLKRVAEREEILPTGARVARALVADLEHQTPSNDEQRRELIEGAEQMLAKIGAELTMRGALGMLSPEGHAAASSATSLMFGLGMALEVAAAAESASSVSAGLTGPEGWFGNV